MSNIHIDASRVHYVYLRKVTGCPPVVARKLSPEHFGWYVETKDGSISIDQAKGGNVWDVKAKCVQKWAELNP